MTGVGFQVIEALGLGLTEFAAQDKVQAVAQSKAARTRAPLRSTQKSAKGPSAIC